MMRVKCGFTDRQLVYGFADLMKQHVIVDYIFQYDVLIQNPSNFSKMLIFHSGLQNIIVTVGPNFKAL